MNCYAYNSCWRSFFTQYYIVHWRSTVLCQIFTLNCIAFQSPPIDYLLLDFIFYSYCIDKLYAIPLVILQEKNYRGLFTTFNNLSTDISLRFLPIDYLWVAVQIAQKHHLFDYSGFSSNSHLIFWLIKY